MNESIQIEEAREQYWKAATIAFSLLAVILFVIFWNMTDVFWTGIVRLASFISFAIAVLAGLKTRESGLSIEIYVSDQALNIQYLKKQNVIGENRHNRADVESISCFPANTLFQLSRGNEFVIQFGDSDQEFDLFHFGGRTLKIDDLNAKRLIRFFRGHEIQVINDIE